MRANWVLSNTTEKSRSIIPLNVDFVRQARDQHERCEHLYNFFHSGNASPILMSAGKATATGAQQHHGLNRARVSLFVASERPLEPGAQDAGKGLCCSRSFVRFFNDRRLAVFVLFFLVLIIVVFIIAVVRVTRRRRIADLAAPSRDAVGDVRGHRPPMAVRPRRRAQPAGRRKDAG